MTIKRRFVYSKAWEIDAMSHERDAAITEISAWPGRFAHALHAGGGQNVGGRLSAGLNFDPYANAQTAVPVAVTIKC